MLPNIAPIWHMPRCFPASRWRRSGWARYTVWQRRSEWILRGDGSGSVQWPEDARLRCNSGDGLRQIVARRLERPQAAHLEALQQREEVVGVA